MYFVLASLALGAFVEAAPFAVSSSSSTASATSVSSALPTSFPTSFPTKLPRSAVQLAPGAEQPDLTSELNGLGDDKRSLQTTSQSAGPEPSLDEYTVQNDAAHPSGFTSADGLDPSHVAERDSTPNPSGEFESEAKNVTSAFQPASSGSGSSARREVDDTPSVAKNELTLDDAGKADNLVGRSNETTSSFEKQSNTSSADASALGARGANNTIAQSYE